ncbi:MAG: DUF3078 domain-containing protein [Bacteroidales bacterium]|nr:DUF3078 domain-containing protein [Bacteroidales bacterium]
MKKITLVLAAFITAFATASAQEDLLKATAEAAAAFSESAQEEVPVEKPSYWTKYAVFDLGFNQTALWSWASGGYNTATLRIGIDLNANYAKEMATWTNRLQMMYGFLWSADKENLIQKSADLLQFESRFGYQTSPESFWKYTADFTMRSQFSNSYDTYVQGADGKWSGTLKSGFFAPGYMTFGVGMAWDPAPWFSLNLSPVTGGFTFCSIPELRKGYGMQLREPSLDPLIGSNYNSQLFQLGAQIKANLKASVNDIFTYETQLILFTDYLNHPFKYNRVNWDNKLSLLVGKYIKLAFDTWLIYDPIVLITDKAGQNPTQRVQFKEFFSFNFTYTLGKKK